MSDHLLSYSMSGRLSSYSIPVHAGASVHVRLVDNTSYLSVLDLIMCACQTESVQARAIWKSVPKEQLAGTLISFPGPLLATTITLAGALKLLGILLPGSCPARERVEAIITAYVTRISEEPNETAQVVTPAVPNGPAQAVEAESSEVPNEPVVASEAGSPKVPNEPAPVVASEAGSSEVPNEPVQVVASEAGSSIPFDDIVPGATVRLAVINGTQYLSVRDIIMHVCGKNVNDSADVWRNITDERKKELKQYLLIFKFPGRGQQDQPVITFPGALKLIMFLPGKNAQDLRSKMVTILTRYFAGDPSLLKEIEANATSESPINRCAREALEGQHIEDTRKRKREELENLKADAELCCSIIEKYTFIMNTYTALCQNPDIDDHAKTVFKEMLLRTA